MKRLPQMSLINLPASLAIIVVYIVLSVAFGTGIMNYLWKSGKKNSYQKYYLL